MIDTYLSLLFELLSEFISKTGVLTAANESLSFLPIPANENPLGMNCKKIGINRKKIGINAIDNAGSNFALPPNKLQFPLSN